MSATATIPPHIPPQATDQAVPFLSNSPESISYWSSYLVPRFQAYLSEAGSYTAEQQAAHVACLRAALPALGPKHPHPHVESALTPNHVPLELSMNLSEHRAPTARFYVEPLGPQTGTDDDPFGEACFPASFARLATQMTSVDTRRYEHLCQVFNLRDPGEIEAAKAKRRPDAWLPKAFMGVDFAGGSRTMKCSFCPFQKFFATGGGWDNLPDMNKLVLEAVRRLPDEGPAMCQALDVLGQYLLPPREEEEEKERGEEDDGGGGRRGDMRCSACARENRPRPFLNLVSVDCTDPADAGARVKLYARIPCTSFACVRDAVTLGGRATDAATLEELRRLRSLWPLLLNDAAFEHNSDDYARPPAAAAVDQLRRGIDLSWEVSGRRPVPEAKVYVPVYLFHANDAEVHGNLRAVFRKLEWHEWAEGRYEKMLHKTLYVNDCAIVSMRRSH